MLTLVDFLQCGNEFRFPSEPKLKLKDLIGNEAFMDLIREAQRREAETLWHTAMEERLLEQQQMKAEITYEWGNSSTGSYTIASANSTDSPFVYRVKA